MADDFINRDELLARLDDNSERWDLIVIGGGATGLGTALDAAARGYRTLLLERDDFAKATSSRSTKLIHGGVRYLRQGNLRLVRESLRERGLLLRNAPQFVHPLRFIVPARTRWEKAFYGVGLKFYDALAGRLGIGRSRILSRDETLRELPNLAPEKLCGGVAYQDAQFDDSRLAIALAKKLHRLGALAINYCGVTDLLKTNGRISGVVARDSETGAEWKLQSRAVVNATGVFSDAMRKCDAPSSAPMMLPSQGVHLVFDRSFFPGTDALMIPKTDDGRVLFAIPWLGRALLGTTDTEVAAPVSEPRPLKNEVAYLLEHAARYLVRAPQSADILSAFAGLRPLVRQPGKSTAKTARNHVISVSESSLITIAGGKWTTFRKMGEDAVDCAERVAGFVHRPSRTADLPIEENEEKIAVSEADEASPLIHPRLDLRESDVVCAVRNEMARTVEDVLARRSRALFLDAQAALESAPVVASLMASALKKSPEWAAAQTREFETVARRYLPPF